jgi:hypothetical protein
VHQRSGAIRKQTLRTRPAPEPLWEWLRIINDIPSRPEVEKAVVVCSSIEGGWLATQFGRHADREQAIQDLRGALRGWGSGALEFLFSPDPDMGVDPGLKLVTLLNARDAFHLIADSERKSSTGYLPLPVNNAAGLYIESGVLRVKLAPFLEVLQGIEVERIRLCAVCRKLFWAGRLDKIGCGEPCSRVLRQRRLRENRAYRKAHPKAKRRS